MPISYASASGGQEQLQGRGAEGSARPDACGPERALVMLPGTAPPLYTHITTLQGVFNYHQVPRNRPTHYSVTLQPKH